MTPYRFTHLAAGALLGAAIATTALAQPKTREDCERLVDYKPYSGQDGKDVVWVPTPDELVQRMLRMGGVTAQDYLVDLGAGDGKIAIAAARQLGARALGIEYNPQMVRLAQCLVQVEGAGGRARVIEGDIFKEDFSTADVVTMYLLPKLNLCVRHRVLAMRPGARVVSHQFTMGAWEPDEVAQVDNHAAYLWIVPARVAGKWSFAGAGEDTPKFTVTLTQDFQKVGGVVTVDGSTRTLLGAYLRGEELRFTYRDGKADARSFMGKVRGKEIKGELRLNGTVPSEVTGVFQGEPAAGSWAERMADCAEYYGG